MNEFIEQFLIECRELVEQATDDLLALEEAPGAADRLDGAFRAFHTLKGAAGIVEFAAMGRALHAAEDLLAAARAGAARVTPSLISDALTCLDQVVQWLDEMQASGELPAQAEVQADALIGRLSRGVAPPAPTPVADDAGWAEALAARHPEAADARTALRYRPDPDCFFQGVDPLAVIEGLPGLQALEIAPTAPWGPLEAMDPFVCQLEFLGLASGSVEELQGHLGPHASDVDLRSLPREPAAPTDLAGLLLQAQLSMLAEVTLEGARGATIAAARVAANVLRQTGRSAAADALERLSTADGSAGLAAAIERALRGEERIVDEVEAHLVAAPEPTMRALRVDVERIDALVSLAGELGVAKNALAHAAALADNGQDPRALSELLKRQHAQLDRLVSDLQRSVLNIRVLPLRYVFQRFPRLLREMVVSLDKPARLVTEGEATEADKVIVEALFEPLLHVLRNAMDHGVEAAAERSARGKAPSATITLRARREGDQVLVEVEDDGGGVDTARVRAVAASRGIASEEALAAMSEAELVELLFSPGFSTASEVTSLSGRGVGMDAVRTAIARLGGRVSLFSRRGEGTRVQFMLPFSVVMSRIMTVEAAGQVFGIPLETIVETVKVPRDAISAIGAARAFVLRERTVPLVDLAQALGGAAGGCGAEATVVVANAGGRLGGLEVDRLGERLDVMLKPLDGLLAGAASVAGTTLTGDGQVLLVLDVAELLQ